MRKRIKTAYGAFLAARFEINVLGRREGYMRQIDLDELARVAANSREDLWAAAKSAGLENPLIILHWTAGWYDNYYPEDYHIEIGEHGEILLSTNDLSEVLPHTWRLNRGTVGVSMCCCACATTEDLGEAPPTNDQIEIMAQIIATLCAELWLTISPKNVLTHGEAGDDTDLYDDDELYGPQNDCERWDLQFLGTDESPEYTSDYSDPSTGGNVLRGKASWYRQQWNRKAGAR